MIESDQKGRFWLYCDFCKQHQRRVYTAEVSHPRDLVKLYICEDCRDRLEYLMDNFARIEYVLDRFSEIDFGGNR